MVKVRNHMFRYILREVKNFPVHFAIEMRARSGTRWKTWYARCREGASYLHPSWFFCLAMKTKFIVLFSVRELLGMKNSIHQTFATRTAASITFLAKAFGSIAFQVVARSASVSLEATPGATGEWRQWKLKPWAWGVQMTLAIKSLI